jgi:hypothetical protein
MVRTLGFIALFALGCSQLWSVYTILWQREEVQDLYAKYHLLSDHCDVLQMKINEAKFDTRVLGNLDNDHRLVIGDRLSRLEIELVLVTVTDKDGNKRYETRKRVETLLPVPRDEQPRVSFFYSHDHPAFKENK